LSNGLFFLTSPTLPKRTANQLSSHAQLVSAKGLRKNSDVSSGHSVLEVIGELEIETFEDLVVETNFNNQ